MNNICKGLFITASYGTVIRSDTASYDAVIGSDGYRAVVLCYGAVSDLITALSHNVIFWPKSGPEPHKIDLIKLKSSVGHPISITKIVP